MPRVVALLRGVNVGGRRLSMAVLREGLEHAGCQHVVTYIQSGNVILTPPRRPSDLATWLGEVATEVAGFIVPVVVRTSSELVEIVRGNPYPAESGAQLHVEFYNAGSAADALVGVDVASFAPEACTAVGRELYLHLPNGMGRATLPTALTKARTHDPAVVSTIRNWNTVLKLRELSIG